MFGPIASHLSQGLGRSVRLETSRDFPSFWAGIAAHRYDVVHLNQYHYARAHAEHGYDAILQNEEFGEKRLAGALFVRRDSGIDSVEDLRGRRILFGGGRGAMMSHIVPLSLLQDAGVRPWEYEAAFAASPVDAVMGVYFRQADAAGAGARVPELAGVAAAIETGELRQIARSEPLPHLPWAVSPELPPALAARIRDLMIGLQTSERGRRILDTAGLSGIQEASDGDYDAHRRIIARTLGEHY
jgi:phosphonate transport system substrate-binding protein